MIFPLPIDLLRPFFQKADDAMAPHVADTLPQIRFAEETKKPVGDAK